MLFESEVQSGADIDVDNLRAQDHTQRCDREDVSLVTL